MKKKVKIILLSILFLIGLGIFLYPYVANWYYQTVMDKEIREFETAISAKVEGSVEQQDNLSDLYQAMDAYNKTIYAEHQCNLTSEESYEVPCMDLTEYGLADNMVGYIEIDRLSLSIPIYLGANEESMAKGVSHLSNTSLPVGGENTNCVISGHRGLASKEMFRHIDRIQIGDQIRIVNFWQTLTYTVTGVEVIEVDEFEKILIQDEKDMVTLLTCHPYRSSKQRYLVYCERSKQE